MSGTRKRRCLTDEDRKLWSSVARTVRPIPGKAFPPSEGSETPVEQVPPSWPVPPAAPQPSSPGQFERRPQPPRASIDRPTLRKLSKGRIDIDATIDLHDMTQTRAYEALLGFLEGAHARGLRHVLVITGKGTATGFGVLREAVPLWLGTPPFCALISSFDRAGRSHGGQGAIYARLKRKMP